MPPMQADEDKPSLLKRTREAKGLTLDIVHEATKIPLDALKAIEEGYSVRVLSPFYYRGFIKIYAEFLGLDVQETFKQYGLGESLRPPVKPQEPPVKPRRPSNEAWEQMQEKWGAVFSAKNLRAFLKAAAVVIVLVLLFKIGGCMVSHIKTMPQKAVIKVRSIKIRRPARQNLPVRREVAQTKAAAPVARTPYTGHKVELAVRAIKNTWMQVKTDDRVVFQTVMKKGTMDSWTADREIELSGRNINELDLEVNGKHIGFLGGHRAKRVIVTREGLTVKK